MTVANMDRSVDFFAKALTFEKVSDVEVAGEEYERLEGVFGLRMRVVRMQLGEETIELGEYLTPRGRSVPADSRSNDRWFQHVAIIVSDMDRASGTSALLRVSTNAVKVRLHRARQALRGLLEQELTA
jgi:catechol 2,3-dioxygenase-like lactoylglutathione lyase family enzyme